MHFLSTLLQFTFLNTNMQNKVRKTQGSYYSKKKKNPKTTTTTTKNLKKNQNKTKTPHSFLVTSTLYWKVKTQAGTNLLIVS